MTSRPNETVLKGAILLCCGSLAFCFQDFIIKAVSGDYSLSQVMTTRCVVAIFPLLLFARLEGGWRALRMSRPGLLMLRSLVLLVSYTTYYLAIAAMPLAQAVAVFFSSPIFIVLLSIPILGERVSPRQVAAVFLGLIGVLIIVRPGADLANPAAIYSLLSAATYGFSAILARRMSDTESATAMSMAQNIVYLSAGLLMGLVLTLFPELSAGQGSPAYEFFMRAWKMPPWFDLGMMACTGLIAATGSWLLTQAYRVAEANRVAPFEYTSILWASLGGFIFWNERPAPSTLIGIACIIVAGIIVLQRRKVPLET